MHTPYSFSYKSILSQNKKSWNKLPTFYLKKYKYPKYAATAITPSINITKNIFKIKGIFEKQEKSRIEMFLGKTQSFKLLEKKT